MQNYDMSGQEGFIFGSINAKFVADDDFLPLNIVSLRDLKMAHITNVRQRGSGKGHGLQISASAISN